MNRLTELLPPGAISTRLPAKSAALWILYGDVLMMLIALVAGFIVAARSTIVPIETVRWSGEKAGRGATRWSVQAAATGLRGGAFLGIAVGAVVGVVGALGGLAGVHLWSTAHSGWQKAGALTGAASGALAAATLARILSLARRTRFTLMPFMAEAIVIGLVFGLAAARRNGSAICVLAGLAIAVIAGLGGDQTHSSRVGFVKRLIMGAAIGLAIGVITSQLSFSPPISFAAIWIEAWLFGGLAVGTTVALVVDVSTRRTPASATIRDEGAASSPSSGMRGLVRRWVRWGILGASAGVVPGLIVSALARFGYFPVLKDVALFLIHLALSLIYVVTGTVLIALTVSIAAASMAGFLGALFGVLSGLTGRDVERRAVPNQGIRQSAANVPVFALLGRWLSACRME